MTPRAAARLALALLAAATALVTVEVRADEDVRDDDEDAFVVPSPPAQAREDHASWLHPAAGRRDQALSTRAAYREAWLGPEGILHGGPVSVSGGPRLEVHELVGHSGAVAARAYAVAVHLHAESPLGRLTSPLYAWSEIEAFTHVSGHAAVRGLVVLGLGARF